MIRERKASGPVREPGALARARPANNVRVGDRLSAFARTRTFGAVIARTLFATAALSLAVAAPGHAAAAGKDCGLTSRIDGVRYQVVIETGRSKATCATVKKVVGKYMRSFTAPKPWHCQLGHSANDFAASCSRAHPAVGVKVYAPN